MLSVYDMLAHRIGWNLCLHGHAGRVCCSGCTSAQLSASSQVLTLCAVLCSVYGADWSCKAPIKLVHASYAKSKQQQDEEVVVLSKVLSADINLGYQDIGE